MRKPNIRSARDSFSLCRLGWRAGVGALVLVGCASTPDPYVEDLHASERIADELERDGYYALARHQLRVTANEADAERKGPLELRRCDLFRREREFDLARRCYRDLEQNVLPADQAEARFRFAAVEVELGREKQARQGLEALIVDQPSTEAAEKAARYLLELVGELGADERVALARRLAESLRPQASFDANVRALCSFFLLDVGRVEHARGRWSSSWSALEEGWAQGQDTLWRDELQLARARTARDAERDELALALYRAMLDDRESAWFFGNYDSPYLDNAAWEYGQLLETLGRNVEAVAAYEELINEFRHSSFIDDAAFASARLQLGEGDDKALRRFITSYPSSRHVSAARRLLGDTTE